MPQEQPLIEKSYKRLKQAYEMPAYDDYVKLLETPEGRQKAYGRLSEKYEMPFDFQTFDSDIKKQLPRSIGGQFVEGFKMSNVALPFQGVDLVPTGGVPIPVPVPRTEVPEVREPQTFAQSLATQAGTLLGDLPSMTLGGLLAAPSRNPAVIAGASFAAPEAIRQAQLEFLEKGTDRPFFTRTDLSELAARMVLLRNFQPIPEYKPESIVGSLLKAGVAGAKGFGIGAATAGAVAAAPVGFKAAAEIGTLATLPHLVEGELPTMQNGAEALVLVLGLKLSAKAGKQIAKIAKRRGQTVEEVVKEVKDESDPQKVLDAIEKATEKVEQKKVEVKPPEPPKSAVSPTRPYSAQFNEAVETAKTVAVVTRGLAENVRLERLKEALKDYDPLVAEEITNPRRERGGAAAREERVEVAVEPSEAQKPLVNAIAEPALQVSNLRAQIEAVRSELTKRLEAANLTEAQVPTAEGKAVPVRIEQRAKLSPEQQAIIQDAINKAAEEGGFSVESIGKGLEIIATPEKLPTFDFSQTPIEQLVQMVDPLKMQLSSQAEVLKAAKQLGRDALTDYFFENKARGEAAVPLRGTASTGETVSVKVNRARSASRPDLEPWKQAVEEVEAQQRKLASETEGTLVIGKPQEPATGIEVLKGVGEALGESLKGITELAGGKRLGIKPFSQSDYNAALPHFRAAWKAYKTAGKNFKEFEKDMRAKFGANIDLYLAQYRKEIDSSDFVRILSEATLPDENFVQLDASAPAIWLLAPEQAARTAGKGLINSTGKKAPVEVNLQTPGVQDLTSFIIGSEGQALEAITRDVSHINRVRREAFAETAKVSPKAIADPGRPILGLLTRRRFEKTDAEIVNAAKESYLKGTKPQGVSKAVLNAADEIEVFATLLDYFTVEYGKTLAQLGESPSTVKKSIARLTKLRNKAFMGKNPKDFWNDFEVYIAAHAKTTTIDPVAKAIKRYMNQAGSGAFPENLRKLIYDQIIDAKGRVWLGDRMADSVLQWFAQSKLAKKVGVKIEPQAKPFSRAVGGARSVQAKTKLGYRPIAAAINGLYAFYKPLVKADGPMMKAAQEARRWMQSPEGKMTLEEETYHGSLGISVATDTSGKPIPKESIFGPLGLWMAVEPAGRRFNFSVAYLDALKRGMPEAAAKEFARRMVRGTNLTYVMSATPRIMRSPTARIVTQFKRFLSGEMEFMHSLSPREWARYAIFQSLLVGPRGALLFIKSIPVLAAVGLLDEVEEQINKLQLAGGLPNLLGIDLGPAATLQLPTRPEDAYGVIISDMIKFYKEVYSPALNPELSAEGKLKNAAERLPEFMIAAKNWMDLVESNVDADGWVLDSEGNPQYRLDSDYEKFLVGVLGATTVEKSRIQAAQSMAIREDKRKDEALRILSRRLRKEFALMGTISDSLIDDMIKVGVSDASAIENILESSKLPPEVRIALRARLRDRGKVFELFREP